VKSPHASTAPTASPLGAYWSQSAPQLATLLDSHEQGLSSTEAAARLESVGANTLDSTRRTTWTALALRQFSNALVLLLFFAAIVSGVMGEWLDAGIVLTIVLATGIIGFSREYSAGKAAEALRKRIHSRTRVMRDGQLTDLSAENIVPGDVLLLSAGNLVPADAVVLKATDLFVSEAALTGESFPVEKHAGAIAPDTPLAQRHNCVFLGTNVRSGTARCLVVATGRRTVFGTIAARLTVRPPETEFDRGTRRVGYLLLSAMLVLVVVVFTVHVLEGRPPAETLLFSIALAIGLSPELLPAILSVNLARGAQAMARQGVLVRRLNAIENLGSMDVLCTDKTGTITEGVVRLDGAYDPDGQPSASVLDLAACNAACQTGLQNPLDDAIAGAHTASLSMADKVAEIPFDFARKRVSVVFRTASGARIVSKGAFHEVLTACTHLTGGRTLDDPARDALTARFEAWGRQGLRVIAVATRDIERPLPAFSREDEREMTFAGFLTFLDRPKEGVAQALAQLSTLGVSVKVITGDNGLVARHIGALVGLNAERVLSGREIDALHGPALWHAAERTEMFVEVDPSQKEQIILALKKMGHVVGFLGDGINDAPAMHAADTSLSVAEAVDVAREAADFVLLERGLDVIRRGIEEGRRTFANTLKYILITMSANIGNMISMAIASLVLPFLPLLAGQILLNNFLADIPALGLASDSVDPELVDRPQRWNVGFIGRFMIVFGLLSSFFDFLTFAVLHKVFHATPELFRTAWFSESLFTQLAVALVVRTQRPFIRSRPGHLLLLSTVVLAIITPLIPLLPYASLLGFVPLPGRLAVIIVLITALYVAAAELAKRLFYRRTHPQDVVGPAAPARRQSAQLGV
jgi:Mg2+-importing ATPase